MSSLQTIWKGELMTRLEKILECFDAKHELTIDNPKYKNFTEELFEFLLESDLGNGDASQFPPSAYQKTIECAIVVKENGIAAGLEEIEHLLNKYKVKMITDFQDGSKIKIGQILMKIQGESGRILALERTILNILQRLCGIATMTAKYMEQITRKECFAIGTRKTLLGFWDKKAVQCGGGLSHRLNLEDAAMLKENHLNVLAPEILDGLENIIRQNNNLRFIEIEVTNEKEFWIMARHLCNVKFDIPKVIMFDHFTIGQIKKIIAEMQLKGIYDEILLEASGNIDLKSIGKFAQSGVDVISSGALTHSVEGLDLSLLFNYKK